MAFKTACAIATLAIGIASAVPVRAEEVQPAGAKGVVDAPPAVAPVAPRNDAVAPIPQHTQAEVDHARSTSIGLTVGGFIFGGLGGLFAIGAGLGGETAWLWGGALISSAVFAVGPSIGHYMLGSPVRATLTMLGRLALGTVGTGLFGMGLAPLGGPVGAGYAAGGVVCWLGSIILTIIDLFTFDAYTQPIAPKKDAPVVVAPTAWIGPNSAGLAAVGAF